MTPKYPQSCAAMCPRLPKDRHGGAPTWPQDSPRVPTPHTHDTGVCLSRTATTCVPRTTQEYGPMARLDAHWYGHWPQAPTPSTAHGHGHMHMARRQAQHARGQACTLTRRRSCSPRQSACGTMRARLRQATGARRAVLHAHAPNARRVAHACTSWPCCVQHSAHSPRMR